MAIHEGLGQNVGKHKGIDLSRSVKDLKASGTRLVLAGLAGVGLLGAGAVVYAGSRAAEETASPPPLARPVPTDLFTSFALHEARTPMDTKTPTRTPSETPTPSVTGIPVNYAETLPTSTDSPTPTQTRTRTVAPQDLSTPEATPSPTSISTAEPSPRSTIFNWGQNRKRKKSRLIMTTLKNTFQFEIVFQAKTRSPSSLSLSPNFALTNRVPNPSMILCGDLDPNF